MGATLWIRGRLMRADVANRDFICYWTSGRLLAQHQNPYDRPAAFRLERSLHMDADAPFMMRNPPWAMFLTVPLGWFDAPTAALLWLVLLIASTLVAMRLLKDSAAGTVALVAVFFAPVIICLEAEQMTLFVLLGLALFVHLEKSRPVLAGAALSLVMLKPHLLLIFLMLAALEVIRRRQFAIIGGFLGGFAAMNVIGATMSPHIWSDYLHSMGAEGVQNQFLPNLANASRLLLGSRMLWPMAIPATVALVWALWYWRQHRTGWHWSDRMPVIAAVSVLIAPYSWPYDQVLFWPAILRAYPNASRASRMVLVVLNLAAIAVALRVRNLGNLLYLWTGPAWMLWCVWVWRGAADAERERRAQAEASAGAL